MFDHTKQGEVSIGSEEKIIASFLRPLTRGDARALNLEDDAAVWCPPRNHDLVFTMDALVAGVHFLPDDDAHDIALKALAVNVSDLVAKGATPSAYLMALALSGAPDYEWLGQLCDGLAAGEERWGGVLIGGDLVRTSGPVTISITAVGVVESGRMVKRSGGAPGEQLYVTGTIGDAYVGLELRRRLNLGAQLGLDAGMQTALVERYLRPNPRLRITSALLAHASCAIDISDGLVRDAKRLAAASGCGARIQIDNVPLSPAARLFASLAGCDCIDLMHGGDDYEVLAAVPASEAPAFERAAESASTSVSKIGELQSLGEGVNCVRSDGTLVALDEGGYDHFEA